MSGFHALANRLDKNQTVDKERLELQKEFDQMFPMMTEKEDDTMKLSVEGYLNYKKSYVKNLLFSPERQNLSEFIQFNSLENIILFF